MDAERPLVRIWGHTDITQNQLPKRRPRQRHCVSALAKSDQTAAAGNERLCPHLGVRPYWKNVLSTRQQALRGVVFSPACLPACYRDPDASAAETKQDILCSRRSPLGGNDWLPRPLVF